MWTSIGQWSGRVAAIWIGLLAGTILSGIAIGRFGATPPPADGPLSPGAAFLLVGALHALVLAALAAHARLRGPRLALWLFALQFGAQSVLMQIETLFFGAQVRIAPELVPRILFYAACSAACGATVAAGLFRAPPPTDDRQVATTGIAWRFAAMAAIYVMLYLAAGYGIAWQFPALRAYYGQGADFSLPALIALQAFRGLLWAALAWLMVRHSTGPWPLRAALLAMVFAVFGAAQLLYPNAFMPWSVRLPHLIEVGLSNALLGVIAARLWWNSSHAGVVTARPQPLLR